jgi:CHAD domain-containing protein
MAAEVRETERKYEFGPGAVLPSLLDLPQVARESDLGEQTLEAEYYDTDDLRLIRGGVTLRRRRGGSDAGWHLKLPVSADTRREIRVPLGRTGRRVPAELATLVRAQALGRALQPVALITTRRRRQVLLDIAGTSLAEVMTDEVTARAMGETAAFEVTARAMGETAALSSWREVEIELTGGGPRLLEAADKRLRASGLHVAGHAAKLERALAGRLPAPVPGRKLTKSSAAGDLVLAYGREQVAALQAADPMIRRDEPGSVHDMRVAVRRLRSTLKSFGALLGSPDVSGLSAELKWLGGVLAEARDIEVLASHLQARLAQLPAELVIGPAQARVRTYFAPRAASAREALLETMDSERYIALLTGLDQCLSGALAALALRAGADVLPAAVSRAGRRASSRARRAGRAPAGHARDTALRQTRKAVKDARYAAEAAGPAAGKKSRRLARRMKKLQAMLGDHHDAVMARGAARDIGIRAHLAGENAFSFGILFELLDRDAVTLEERAQRQLARAFSPDGSS